MQAEWIAVGIEGEFGEGVHRIRAKGERLLLTNLNGEFLATTAKCPHAGIPLESAELEGSILTCPLHGWRFDLACAGTEIHGYRGLKARSVRIEAGVIYVSAQP